MKRVAKKKLRALLGEPPKVAREELGNSAKETDAVNGKGSSGRGAKIPNNERGKLMIRKKGEYWQTKKTERTQLV